MANEDLLFKAGINTTQFEKGMTNLISMAKSAVVGFLAFGTAAAAVKALFDHEVEAERATNELMIAVKSASDGSFSAYQNLKLLTEQHVKYGFTIQDTETALTRLVRIFGNTKDAGNALQTVMDFAAHTNKTATESAELLSRAFTGRVQSLKQYGVEIEKGASKEEILAAVHKKFYGEEINQQGTLGQMTKDLNARWNELLDTLGSVNESNFKDFIQFLSDTVGLVEKIAKGFKSWGDSMRDSEIIELQKQLKEGGMDKSVREIMQVELNSLLENKKKELNAEKEHYKKLKAIKTTGDENNTGTASGETEAQKQAKDEAKYQEEMSNKMAKDMTKVFESITKSGKSGEADLKKVFDGILKDYESMITEMVMKKLASGIISGVLDVITGGTALPATSILSNLGLLPKAAEGGITNGPTIAGEKGQELITPLDKAGNIGNTLIMHNYINTIDASGMEQIFSEKIHPAMTKHFNLKNGGIIGHDTSGNPVKWNF